MHRKSTRRKRQGANVRTVSTAFRFPSKESPAGFFIRFFFFFGVPYALLHLLPLDFALNAIATIESDLLSGLGIHSVHLGSLVSSNSAWFVIVSDCSGLVMVSLLFGLLWSTPVSKPVRWRTLAVWAPILLAYNLVRLLAVLYVGGTFGMAAMDSVHLGLWLVDAGFVLAIWWKAYRHASTASRLGSF